MIRYKDTQPYNKGMKKTEKGEKMTRKSTAYWMNFTPADTEYFGEVKKDHMRKITKFPLGYRSEDHNAGTRTIEWFENPASDKQGYTKTLEIKKSKDGELKLNTAVIVYNPIDKDGLNSPSALYNEMVLQDGEL